MPRRTLKASRNDFDSAVDWLLSDGSVDFDLQNQFWARANGWYSLWETGGSRELEAREVVARGWHEREVDEIQKWECPNCAHKALEVKFSFNFDQFTCPDCGEPWEAGDAETE